MNYDGLRFRSVENSASGDVGEGTSFHYRQRGDVVWATYEGGAVRFGTLVATVDETGCLDMRYQHVAADGELKTGLCRSRPERLADGRLRLHERWRWTSGVEGDSAADDSMSGESIIEQYLPEESDLG